jgi:hypothetical protein
MEEKAQAMKKGVWQVRIERKKKKGKMEKKSYELRQSKGDSNPISNTTRLSCTVLSRERKARAMKKGSWQVSNRHRT